MKFTRSVDGIDRTVVHVSLRLTAGDIAILKRMATKEERSWRDALRVFLACELSGLLSRFEDEEHEEQEYEKERQYRQAINTAATG